MNLLRDAPLWAQILLALLLLVAAIEDVRRLRISNLLCLGVILVALAAMASVGLTTALWQNFALFALLLAVGTPLFAAGWLGGGDVKLLAALGLWCNFAAILPLLSCIFLIGGVLALVSLASHRKLRSKRRIPYGLAIASGVGLMLGWNWSHPPVPRHYTPGTIMGIPGG